MISDTTTLGLFLIYLLIFFVAILMRYFVAAGVFYWYYYGLRQEKFARKRLSPRGGKKGQIKKEIVYSIKASAIFAAMGAVTFWMWQNGFTAIYSDISSYGYWYLLESLLMIFLIHETYYYWMHRWMHHPRIFKYVHKVHHASLAPTPWTAFSFHPWESIIQALILPFILIFLPVNIFVLGFYLLAMTLSSVVNHLDIEIYSQTFLKSRIGKFFIGATHHHYHHAEFHTNYGLYFTFWDRWMGTQRE